MKEVEALVQAEVDKIAGVALGRVSDNDVLSVLCQQGRAVIPVNAVVFGYKGESWPVDRWGNDMPAKAVAVMDADLGSGARLVEDFAKTQEIAESLVDGLCTRADCAEKGCKRLRSGR